MSSSSDDRARLFVAVWPPSVVVDALASLRHTEPSGVRWMGPEQWHVTLRFLGTVDVTPAVDALARLRGTPPARAVTGVRTGRMGREVLALPVDGLGELAAAVVAAFAGLGRDPEHATFRGHLTLARGRGVRSLGRPALASPLEWEVDEVTLVRSYLGRGGARYEAVAVADLGHP